MSLPNIVFILCDDLGINDLHCYGRDDHNTPNLDLLAEQGARFTSSYASQAICSASRAGLLTGLNPARLHLTTFLPGRCNKVSQRVLHPEIMMNVPLDIKTFPKYFKEAGYTTGFIGKWHIGSDIGPKEHGFDHVYFKGEGRCTTPSETEGGKAEYELTDETIKFIESCEEKPFVAYLGHYTPHIPYSAKEYLVDKNRDAFEPVYAALIETLDDTIGILMNKLDELNIADNTIFVFTSDNGGLHVPEWTHDRVTHNTPYRAGKGYVYEGGQRVPLIIRWPGHIKENTIIDSPVNNIDWIPTLLELAGQQVPSNVDGISFAKGLLGEPIPKRKLFWHFPHYTNQGGRPSGAMRDGKWLLIELYDENKIELYDINSDCEENQDLSEKYPDIVSKMLAELDTWRKENNVQYNTPNAECNEELFKKLYIHFDPGKFDPATADDQQWKLVHEWRKAMDDKTINNKN